jgi:hypothetical protein
MVTRQNVQTITIDEQQAGSLEEVIRSILHEIAMGLAWGPVRVVDLDPLPTFLIS